jgi:CheY-like chemotaxis protein
MATLSTAPRRGRVLVVDDDAEVRALMQAVLERNGFEVITVDGGADALAYLARDVPPLILLDLEMDDMNGWEVLTSLRRHPRFGSFRVVVVSGAHGHVPKWAGYLRKPFRIAALLELLDGAAASSASAGANGAVPDKPADATDSTASAPARGTVVGAGTGGT